VSVLWPHAEELREQADPPHRLPPRALEVVVELRVLELRQVERGGVLHEPHRDAVREQVAQQALHEHGGAREHLPTDHDRELEEHEPREALPVGGRALRRLDEVDDELRHPERRDRHEGAHHPQHHDGQHVAAVRPPDETEQRRHVAERGDALAPRRRRRGGRAAAGAGRGGGRDHAERVTDADGMPRDRRGRLSLEKIVAAARRSALAVRAGWRAPAPRAPTPHA
jgi:hypothetical protein